MIPRRLAVLFSLIVLSACASAKTTVAEPLPAHQAEAVPTPPPQPELLIPALAGWTKSEARADPSRVFLTRRKPVMTLRVALVRTDDSPEDYVRGEVACNAKLKRPTSPVEVTSNGIASAKWRGKIGGKARKGVVAAKRSATAPNDLIVISGYWPASAGKNLEQQIDMIILLTSAK